MAFDHRDDYFELPLDQKIYDRSNPKYYKNRIGDSSNNESSYKLIYDNGEYPFLIYYDINNNGNDKNLKKYLLIHKKTQNKFLIEKWRKNGLWNYLIDFNNKKISSGSFKVNNEREFFVEINKLLEKINFYKNLPKKSHQDINSGFSTRGWNFTQAKNIDNNEEIEIVTYSLTHIKTRFKYIVNFKKEEDVYFYTIYKNSKEFLKGRLSNNDLKNTLIELGKYLDVDIEKTVRKKILNLKKKELSLIKDMEYQKIIDVSKKIINLAQKIQDNILIAEQEKILKNAENRIENDPVISEIKEYLKSIEEKYNALINNKNFVEAHKLIQDFIKKYKSVYDLNLIPHAKDLISVDKLKWKDEQNRLINKLKKLEEDFKNHLEDFNISTAEKIYRNGLKFSSVLSNAKIKKRWKKLEDLLVNTKEKKDFIEKFNIFLEESVKLRKTHYYDKLYFKIKNLDNEFKKIELPEYYTKLIALRNEIKKDEDLYKERLKKISVLKDKIDKYKKESNLERIIYNCNKIIELGHLVQDLDIVKDYKSFLEKNKTSIEKSDLLNKDATSEIGKNKIREKKEFKLIDNDLAVKEIKNIAISKEILRHFFSISGWSIKAIKGTAFPGKGAKKVSHLIIHKKSKLQFYVVNWSKNNNWEFLLFKNKNEIERGKIVSNNKKDYISQLCNRLVNFLPSTTLNSDLSDDKINNIKNAKSYAICEVGKKDLLTRKQQAMQEVKNIKNSKDIFRPYTSIKDWYINTIKGTAKKGKGAKKVSHLVIHKKLKLQFYVVNWSKNNNWEFFAFQEGSEIAKGMINALSKRLYLEQLCNKLKNFLPDQIEIKEEMLPENENNFSKHKIKTITNILPNIKKARGVMQNGLRNIIQNLPEIITYEELLDNVPKLEKLSINELSNLLQSIRYVELLINERYEIFAIVTPEYLIRELHKFLEVMYVKLERREIYYSQLSEALNLQHALSARKLIKYIEENQLSQYIVEDTDYKFFIVTPREYPFKK